VTEALDKAAKERKAAEDHAFADKLPKRLPPNEVERAEIDKARKRTKTRLADIFGTRSLQFVNSMLNGLGKATEDHSLNLDFSPGSPDRHAFNATLAVIDGVRPKDEIEAMLAAHMAVTNITLLELFARTRGAIAGHPYQGDGIKRLDVLGNLTNKFMRTYTMQVEALANGMGNTVTVSGPRRQLRSGRNSALC
jgi:hypothetical protein